MRRALAVEHSFIEPRRTTTYPGRPPAREGRLGMRQLLRSYSGVFLKARKVFVEQARFWRKVDEVQFPTALFNRLAQFDPGQGEYSPESGHSFSSQAGQ